MQEWLWQAPRDFEHESFQDRESIIRYLTAISDGFEQGTLTLSSNGDKFSLDTPGLVKFDVRAKQKDSRSQIVLKFSWKSRRKGSRLKIQPLAIEADPTMEKRTE